jgi:hypothetical protein
MNDNGCCQWKNGCAKIIVKMTAKTENKGVKNDAIHQTKKQECGKGKLAGIRTNQDDCKALC